jgi:hypothetical protein
MQPRTNLRRAVLVAFALACAIPATHVHGAPLLRPLQTSSTFEARVDDFLRQSGYEHRKVKANSWYVIMKGKQLPQIRIIIGAGQNNLAVGAVVVPKRNLRVTSESLYKMMKLSYDLNYVRVCIDLDDDLLVMSQMKDRWLDLQEFKTTVERVATAADRAYGEMRPFLAPAN